jgi:hypothetical protein
MAEIGIQISLKMTTINSLGWYAGSLVWQKTSRKKKGILSLILIQIQKGEERNKEKLHRSKSKRIKKKKKMFMLLSEIMEVRKLNSAVDKVNGFIIGKNGNRHIHDWKNMIMTGRILIRSDGWV